MSAAQGSAETFQPLPRRSPPGREAARTRLVGGAGVVAIGFAAMLASSPGQSYWISLFVDRMIEGTGLSRPAFTAIYGVATLCSAATVLAVGRLVDRRGLALGWLVVAAGLAAGCLLISFATGALVAFVALAMLRAFGQGSFPLLGTLLVAGRLNRWRGRGLAVSHLGSTLAAAALPAIAVLMIAAVGWRDSYRIVAVVVIVLVTPLAFVVARLAPGRSAAERRAAPAVRTRAVRSFPWRGGGGVLLLILAAPPLVSTAAVFHATSILSERGMPIGAAAAALAALALAGATGSLTGGVLVDRYGPRFALVAMSLLLTASVGLLLVPGDAPAYSAFVVLGLASGLNGTVSGAVWARTYGIERLGALQSTGEAARIGAAAIGPLPLALSLSLAGSYATGLIGLAAFSAVCVALGARWRPSTHSLEVG